MLSAERHQRIIDFLRERRSASIVELAGEIGASPSTVGRDLSVLAAEGLVQRVRGGASIGSGLRPDLPSRLERLRNVQEKDIIGAAAAAQVRPGEVVFLEASTTVLHVARHLRKLHGLTVVTNDIHVAVELADSPHIETILTGGTLRQATQSLIGPLVERVLDTIHVDAVFTGISGIDPEHGLSTGNMIEAQTKLRLLSIGERIIGVSDHTKFGRVAFCRLGPVDALDVLVTDSLAPAGDLERIRDLGVEVIVAAPAEASLGARA